MLWTRLHEAVPVDVPLRSTRKQREMMGTRTTREGLARRGSMNPLLVASVRFRRFLVTVKEELTLALRDAPLATDIHPHQECLHCRRTVDIVGCAVRSYASYASAQKLD